MIAFPLPPHVPTKAPSRIAQVPGALAQQTRLSAGLSRAREDQRRMAPDDIERHERGPQSVGLRRCWSRSGLSLILWVVGELGHAGVVAPAARYRCWQARMRLRRRPIPDGLTSEYHKAV